MLYIDMLGEGGVKLDTASVRQSTFSLYIGNTECQADIFLKSVLVWRTFGCVSVDDRNRSCWREEEDGAKRQSWKHNQKDVSLSAPKAKIQQGWMNQRQGYPFLWYLSYGISYFSTTSVFSWVNSLLKCWCVNWKKKNSTFIKENLYM